jgi:hypothetical protein
MHEHDYMRLVSRIFAGLIFLLAAGCASDDEEGGFQILTYNYDFNNSHFDWQGGFADYPTSGDTTSYELQYRYTHTPSSARNSLMISGNNHSDDLFMYIKKKIEGLSPDTEYTMTLEVEFASEAREGTVGIGGAPGESVYLKVGAVPIEPKTLQLADQFVMNIDKGHQSESGDDMIKIGDIAVPADTDGFVLTTRSNSPYDGNSSFHQPIMVRSNNEGELWLIVGTDSGYEGTTTIYYTKVAAVFSKSR